MTESRLLHILRCSWLTTVLALHVCAVWMAPRYTVWLGELGHKIAVSVWVAQWLLLAFWLALAPSRWFLRLPVLGALAALMVVLTVRRDPVNVTDAWELATLGACALAPALAARTSGYRVERWRASIHGTRRPIQFSLRSVLLLTAIAAVTVKAGQWLHQFFQSRPEGTLLIYAINALIMLPMVLAAWWAIRSALGLGKPIWRLLILTIAAPPLGLITPLLLYVDSNRTEMAREMVPLMIFQTAIVAATALAVRLGGYRLIKGPPVWQGVVRSMAGRTT